jgi:hypothetical protein
MRITKAGREAIADDATNKDAGGASAKPDPKTAAIETPKAKQAKPGKIDVVIALLSRPETARFAESVNDGCSCAFFDPIADGPLATGRRGGRSG